MTTPTPIDLETIQRVTETRVVEGIRLPWVRQALPKHWIAEQRGEVFIDAGTLVTLSEQGEWDSQLGEPLVLSSIQGLALEQAGLAVQETKGGYHGTDECVALVRRLGWL